MTKLGLSNALILLLGFQAWGSPIPATGTSALTSVDQGFYLVAKGFKLGTLGTHWMPSEDQSMSRGEVGSSLRFSNKQRKTAQVHLKTDFLKAEMSLEAYAKRWIKDYNQLGLDVLGTRSFASGATRGVVVDSIQNKKKLQFRQAVFLRRKSVVILTCSDKKEQFAGTLDECNRLIKNFSWNEEKPSLRN